MVNNCSYELWEEGETSVKITTVSCEDGHTESKIQYQKATRFKNTKKSPKTLNEFTANADRSDLQ